MWDATLVVGKMRGIGRKVQEVEDSSSSQNRH